MSVDNNPDLSRILGRTIQQAKELKDTAVSHVRNFMSKTITPRDEITSTEAKLDKVANEWENEVIHSNDLTNTEIPTDELSSNHNVSVISTHSEEEEEMGWESGPGYELENDIRSTHDSSQIEEEKSGVSKPLPNIPTQNPQTLMDRAEKILKDIANPELSGQKEAKLQRLDGLKNEIKSQVDKYKEFLGNRDTLTWEHLEIIDKNSKLEALLGKMEITLQESKKGVETKPQELPKTSKPLPSVALDLIKRTNRILKDVADPALSGQKKENLKRLDELKNQIESQVKKLSEEETTNESPTYQDLLDFSRKVKDKERLEEALNKIEELKAENAVQEQETKPKATKDEQGAQWLAMTNAQLAERLKKEPRVAKEEVLAEVPKEPVESPNPQTVKPPQTWEDVVALRTKRVRVGEVAQKATASALIEEANKIIEKVRKPPLPKEIRDEQLRELSELNEKLKSQLTFSDPVEQKTLDVLKKEVEFLNSPLGKIYNEMQSSESSFLNQPGYDPDVTDEKNKSIYTAIQRLNDIKNSQIGSKEYEIKLKFDEQKKNKLDNSIKVFEEIKKSGDDFQEKLTNILDGNDEDRARNLAVLFTNEFKIHGKNLLNGTLEYKELQNLDKNKDFSNSYITAVQRALKYPLFLKDLREKTDNPIDKEHIQGAMELAEMMAKEINAKQDWKDELPIVAPDVSIKSQPKIMREVAKTVGRAVSSRSLQPVFKQEVEDDAKKLALEKEKAKKLALEKEKAEKTLALEKEKIEKSDEYKELLQSAKKANRQNFSARVKALEIATKKYQQRFGNSAEGLALTEPLSAVEIYLRTQRNNISDEEMKNFLKGDDMGDPQTAQHFRKAPNIGKDNTPEKFNTILKEVIGEIPNDPAQKLRAMRFLQEACIGALDSYKTIPKELLDTMKLILDEKVKPATQENLEKAIEIHEKHLGSSSA